MRVPGKGLVWSRRGSESQFKLSAMITKYEGKVKTLEVQIRKCQIPQQWIIWKDGTVEKKKRETRGKETNCAKEKRKPNRK